MEVSAGDGWGIARLQVTSDPDAVTGHTRRLSRTFRGSKSDAKRALQRLVVEAGAGLQGGSEITVGVLLAQFMATATLPSTTRFDWESVVNRQLVPELGEIPLWKLSARHCDRLYHRMEAAGLSPSRDVARTSCLHRAVAQALRWGRLTRNPVLGATRPEVPRATIVPPDADQVRQLLAAAQEQDPALACWLDVAAATGTRRGEVCGLRWADIDVDAATIRIERSVSATQRGAVRHTTNADQFRLISLTAQAVASLAQHLEHARAMAAASDRLFDRSDLVFTNDAERQRPWRPEFVTRRWERLRKQAGLDHVKIHGLRHVVATPIGTITRSLLAARRGRRRRRSASPTCCS